MMKRFFCIFFSVLLGILLLTGCGYQADAELGNVNVVIGLYLDVSPANGHYILKAEIADFSEYEKSSDISAKILQSEGTSIADAMAKLNQISDKELYFSHAKMILLGSGFQSVDIENTVEYFTRHPHINSNIHLCMSQNDLLSKKEETSDSVFQPLCSLLERDTETDFPTLYQLYRKENAQFSLPLVIKTENGAIISSAIFFNYHHQMTVDNFQSSTTMQGG